MARDTWSHTMAVAAILCVVCSVLVASAAVGLRPKQEANKAEDQMKNVLIAAGLFDKSKNKDSEVHAIFEKNIDRKLIDLDTGEPVPSDVVDPSSYDQREAPRKPKLSDPVEPPNGLGGIKRREKYSFVYEVKGESGEIEQVVLPVYGKGLWSTLYGFLAVDKDGDTVRGITFYEEGETPGLGGEVENPRWTALWKGKKLFGEDGQVDFDVIKGTVTSTTEDAEHKVDGLSGATITSNGVQRLIRYWAGPHGFGPFLDKFRQAESGGTRG